MADETFARLLHLVFASPLSGDGFRLVFHGGEPLAAGCAFFERAIEILARENKAGVPIQVGLQTNGTLIDAAWVDLFRRHRIEVGVSLDGPAALHDAHRRARNGRGSFEAAMRGVAALNAGGYPFDVIAVLTRDSLDHAAALLPFFAAAGARSVGFNIEEIEDAHRRSSLAFDGVDDAFDRFYDALIAGGSSLERPLPVRELEEGLLRIAAGGPALDDQRTPLKIVTCDWQGNLSTFSPELIGARSPAHRDFVFGHVSRIARLEDLLRDEALQRCAAEIACGVAACGPCPYFEACGGGAPANKFFERGSLSATDTLFCRLAVQAPIRACVELVALDRSEGASFPEQAS